VGGRHDPRLGEKKKKTIKENRGQERFALLEVNKATRRFRKELVLTEKMPRERKWYVKTTGEETRSSTKKGDGEMRLARWVTGRKEKSGGKKDG